GQLADIEKVHDLNGLFDYFVKYGKEGGNPFFGGYVYAHMKNSSMNAVYLGGGSLVLGSSYFQQDDEKNRQTLMDYTQYVDTLYTKGVDGAKGSKGGDVVAFEKSIASYLKTIEEMRDAQKRYNPVAVADLGKIVKNMDVAKYLDTMGFRADTVIISE